MRSPEFSSLSRLSLIAVFLLPISGCRKPSSPPEAEKKEIDRLVAADSPVLPLSPGLQWRYLVTVENPQDSRGGGTSTGKFERTRRYLGKIDPENGQPPADCFEVSASGAKTWREFVKIEPGEISLLGQAEVDSGAGKKPTVWFEKPIPFFKAGLLAGDSMPVTVLKKSKDLWRGTRVIGREKVTVPAGEFETVRLQMFGSDGKISLRKTYWFAPGKGIVREEKVREIDGKPIMTETEELISLQPGAK